MAAETYLSLDVIELKTVAKYFHLIAYDIELKKDVSIQFPRSVSVADCQYFLDNIIQAKPVLPKLLSVLHASTIFILADFFCVDLIFEELHASFTHSLTFSPLFMKLFVEYYSHTHPQTVDFYHAFTESFKIPKSKLTLHNVSCTGMKSLKKIARDHHRRTIYINSLRVASCHICKRNITYTENEAMMYDKNKVTKMPCCATPTHPWCTYNMLYRRNGFYCCKRCKTLLHNGQSSFVDINYAQFRMKLRSSYGISVRRILPALNFDKIVSMHFNC